MRKTNGNNSRCGGGDPVLRRGFTLIEVIMAMAVSVLVISAAWSVFSAMMGRSGKTNVVTLTADSFLRQDAVDAIKSLTRRLQESIQVLEPRPGQSGSSLLFRDILNNEIKLEVKDGALLSFRGDQEETVPAELMANGKPFTPAKPIRIPGCVEATFTALTPTCVSLSLTFKGDTDKKLSVVNTVLLQNRDLAR